jgi:hypothetical protein
VQRLPRYGRGVDSPESDARTRTKLAPPAATTAVTAAPVGAVTWTIRRPFVQYVSRVFRCAFILCRVASVGTCPERSP